MEGGYTSRSSALVVVLVTLVVVIAVFRQAEAQPPCGVSGAGFMACLPYVRRGIPQAGTPPDTCCKAISAPNVLPCLCNLYKSSPGQVPSWVDPQAAMSLPKRCGITGFQCAKKI